MADQTAPETGEQAPAEPQGAETPQTATEDGLPESIKGILDKERKLAREAERRAKAAERKAQEFEDRDKSETEKAAARAERAEKRAEEAERRLLRTQVALEHNVPADLMEFLSGDDRDSMEKQAKALIAHLKPRDAADFDSGARERAPEPKTPEEAHQELLLGLLGRRGAPSQ